MSIEWFIYLLGLVDGFKSFFAISLIISFGILLVLFLNDVTSFDKEVSFLNAFKKYKKFIFSNLLIAIVVLLIPNSKTLALIASVSYGKEVIQTEEFGKVKKILDLKLDEVLKDLEGKK